MSDTPDQQSKPDQDSTDVREKNLANEPTTPKTPQTTGEDDDGAAPVGIPA